LTDDFFFSSPNNQSPITNNSSPALAVNLSEEVPRKMRDTASETLALPFEESASSFSYPITNNE
jgi:hypothetical protein